MKIKHTIKNIYLIFRHYTDRIMRRLVVYDVRGGHNEIICPSSTRFENTTIIFKGKNNKIQFGKNGVFRGARFYIEGDNNKIIIGDDVSVNASKDATSCFNAVGGKSIIIQDGCLISNNVEIHTSDYHGIYTQDGKRVNQDADIIIGKNVWIGLRVLILKGTVIEDGNIIGAGTILSGEYKESNCIIVGIPGKVKRTDVKWKC